MLMIQCAGISGQTEWASVGMYTDIGRNHVNRQAGIIIRNYTTNLAVYKQET